MKISVITAVYNRKNTIERVIQSIRSQDYNDIEYIIIDGSSNDGTCEIIKQNLQSGDKFISEPDFGIYDALNKGIELSTGEIICFLHSDDIFDNNNVLTTISSIFKNQDFDVVYGDVIFFNKNNIALKSRHYKSKKLSKKNLSWGFMPAHPAMFIRKNVYKEIGLFNINYKIAGDYDFLCRLVNHGKYKFKKIPNILIRMQSGGVSTKNIKNKILLNREVLRACKNNKINSNYIKLIIKYFFKIIELY